MMRYDIIEGINLQEAFNKGYEKYKTLPLGLKEVWTLRDKKLILDRWYDVGTVFFKGDVRKGTLKEFKNLEKFYGVGGRVLFAGGYPLSLCGYDNLGSGGRFVWVVPKAQKKVKA